MERMGLWGDGAPFKSFVEFLETVQRKGLGQSLLQASFIFMLNKEKEPVHCFGGRGWRHRYWRLCRSYGFTRCSGPVTASSVPRGVGGGGKRWGGGVREVGGISNVGHFHREVLEVM